MANYDVGSGTSSSGVPEEQQGNDPNADGRQEIKPGERTEEVGADISEEEAPTGEPTPEEDEDEEE